jgi:FKBP-type peptidyl-prolyl cis-trans isomerase FkpA
MNKIIKQTAALLLAASFTSSCAEEGFKKTATGLEYKFIRKDDGARKVNKDDILILNLAYYTDTDSLFFDSKSRPEGFVYIPLMESAYKGDIMEGLSMMNIGDSVIFKVVADSFFIHNAMIELPKGIAPGSKLTFYAGLRDAKTRQELMEEQMKSSAVDPEEMKRLAEQEPIDRQQYLEKNGIVEKPKESGLIYVEKLKGKGAKAEKGKKVKVHYAGYLLSGRKFDSSYDRGEPIEFTLGVGQVIGGWDEGISYMNVGTTAQLIIPSIIGYGTNGSGMIPPYATLVFDVELIAVE